MKKSSSSSRRRVAIFGLGLAVTAALLGLWLGANGNEPRHNGLTAKEWIAATARKKRTGYTEQDIRTASDALLNLGTNAFPAVKNALIGSSPLQGQMARVWDKLPSLIQKRVARPLTAGELSETARDLFQNWSGEQRELLAKFVAPALLEMARDTRRNDRAWIVAGILRELGPPAEMVMPTLRELLREPAMRESALFMLIDYAHGTKTKSATIPAIPELIECLGDTNESVLNLAIQTLGLIGPPARAAVPILEKALNGPKRELAAEALWAIDRQTNTALRVLPHYVEDVSGNAVATLAQLGPAARPALAALLSGLESKSGNVRMNSARAIWKIAPEHLPRILEAVVQPLTNGIHAGPYDWDNVGPAWYAAHVLKEMGDDAAPARWAIEMGLTAKATNIVEECRSALEVVGSRSP